VGVQHTPERTDSLSLLTHVFGRGEQIRDWSNKPRAARMRFSPALSATETAALIWNFPSRKRALRRK
jgi:hypothetical protein